MAKHKSKETLDLVNEAVERLGFRVRWIELNSKGFLYPPEKNYECRLFHVGEGAIKKLESYLRNYENWKKSH